MAVRTLSPLVHFGKVNSLRSRLLVTLIVSMVLVGACSSGSSSESDEPQVDQEFQQLVEGFENGTLPPAPVESTTIPRSSTTASGGDSALESVNVPCLSAQVTKRIEDGEYTAADVALWVQGLPSPIVQKVADEIVASGQCSQ